MTFSIKTILVALAVCVASTTADAATIYVANNGLDNRSCGTKPKAPCRSISRGLEVAAAGDTIEVGPGLYGDIDADGQFTSPGDERKPSKGGCDCLVHVTKAVTIVSRSGATQTLVHPGPPTANGEYTGAGFTAIVQIDAPGVVFGQKDHGFTITSRAVPLGGDGLSAVRIGELAAGTEIRGNFLAMNLHGIFSSAGDVVITDNLIQTNVVGVMMEGAYEALISGNGVQGNNVGIGVLAENATFSGNLVTGNFRLGITIHGGTGNTVSGNSVLGNGVGVVVQTAAEATVHDNNIFGNDTTGTLPANAGLLSNSTEALDVSNNYWGAPTVGSFPGDSLYNLGTGSLDSTPIANDRFKIALQPMR